MSIAIAGPVAGIPAGEGDSRGVGERLEHSEARRQLQVAARRLAKPNALRSLLDIGGTWVTIVAGLWLYSLYPSPWLLPLVMIYIGARQYALLILLHDAGHRLLHADQKVNDRLAVWLIAAPCGSTYFNSRQLHLDHHGGLGQGERDPDYFYYCTDHPSPKHSVTMLIWHFTKLLAGGQIFHTLFAKHENSRAPSGKSSPNLMVRVSDLATAFYPVRNRSSQFASMLRVTQTPLLSGSGKASGWKACSAMLRRRICAG